MARTADLSIQRDPSRSKPWWISIPPKLSATGRRQKRFFLTKAEAEGAVQRLKVRKENHGIAAKLLTPADEQQAQAALRLLREAGFDVQLVAVVGKYIEQEKERAASKTLSVVWNSFVKAPRRKPLGKAYLTSMKFAKEMLEPLHETLVADITSKQLEDCLTTIRKGKRKGETTATSYQEATLQRVQAVLNYAIEKGWLKKKNPAKDCNIIHPTKTTEVEIYTPQEVESLLTTTASLYPELVPAVAVMAFAGVRPDVEDGEITKLAWDRIILKDRQKRIEVPTAATKTKKSRTIKIRPALASWLEWHKRREGSTEGLLSPYRGTGLRNRLREIHSKAKVKRIQDGLRHSFASYLVPIDGKESVSLELGHSAGDVLEKHYLKSVTRTIANKFWALRAPMVEKPARGKVIDFRKAA
jgi:site-specific recombinase XerD